jgi:hypothetical protein
LLSAGQFSDAAKAYSEAILLSPADYLLFYKRATAYFSLSRHASALDDFAKVLALTSGEFDPALMMTAKIHTRMVIGLVQNRSLHHIAQRFLVIKLRMTCYMTLAWPRQQHPRQGKQDTPNLGQFAKKLQPKPCA